MIVAIGGPASAGTTTLARAIAIRIGAARLVHVDDLARAHGMVLDVDRVEFWRRPTEVLLDDQRAVVEMNLGYGRWLAAEAARADLPTVTSHPWDTLLTRSCAALGLEA